MTYIICTSFKTSTQPKSNIKKEASKYLLQYRIYMLFTCFVWRSAISGTLMSMDGDTFTRRKNSNSTL